MHAYVGMMIGAYLRSKWNQLDFFILFTSILSVSVSGSGFRFSRAFRAFRSLRPLRVVTAFPNTRIVLSMIDITTPQYYTRVHHPSMIMWFDHMQ